jgi:hypothetical protein
MRQEHLLFGRAALCLWVTSLQTLIVKRFKTGFAARRRVLRDDRLGAGRAFLQPPLISDIADVRQHLLAEQFERFHQLAGIFRARCPE